MFIHVFFSIFFIAYRIDTESRGVPRHTQVWHPQPGDVLPRWQGRPLRNHVPPQAGPGESPCCFLFLVENLFFSIILFFCLDPYQVGKITNAYTQRNLFEILLDQIEIRLYLSFFRLIWNQTDTVRLLFQINRKMVNAIWFQFDLIRFLCVCNVHSLLET